jgi:hypothetical protein
VYQSTHLYSRLQEYPHLLKLLEDVRTAAERLTLSIPRELKDFTDHSVTHMDALWGVADSVITTEECKGLSGAEVFLLASSFYTHDLGMSLACTEEGVALVKASPEYATTLDRLKRTLPADPDRLSSLAIQLATRAIHAQIAEKLTEDILPGLGIYILPDPEQRRLWAKHLGVVSASHHWSLAEIESSFGRKNRIPSVVAKESLDLAYVACLLRVIDYAHINSDRASYWERLTRGKIDEESLIHWKAQEFITGPLREGNHLKYSTVHAIQDVDAWWLFYSMAEGLDNEIRSVREYLDNRSCSRDRFTLTGVTSAASPEELSKLVETEGFEPIDIRLQPTSMERLVDLLGGKALYGENSFAPVRELVQNARDAIELRLAREKAQKILGLPGHIDVRVDIEGETSYLVVADNGVGMSEKTVTKHLLGVASDYWSSKEFFEDFPGTASEGFRPVGKFGIGFLSTFMLGNRVIVNTQRANGPRLQIELRGIGKRGALRRLPSMPYSGTEVKIELSDASVKSLAGLAEQVRRSVPMLKLPIAVTQGDSTTLISPGWWRSLSQSELEIFAGIDDRELDAKTKGGPPVIDPGQEWPGVQPELSSESQRLLLIPTRSHILVCSKGFAVSTATVSGFAGMIDIEELEVNAARAELVDWNSPKWKSTTLKECRRILKDACDRLGDRAMLQERFRFIESIAAAYGWRTLSETSLRWIPYMAPPGEIRFISARELHSIATDSDQISVVYGADPWSLGPLIRELSLPSIRTPTVLLWKTATAASGSILNEIIRRPLEEMFRSPSRTVKRRTPAHITAVVNLISASWSLAPEVLLRVPWAGYRNAGIAASFSRNAFEEKDADGDYDGMIPS